MKWLCPTCLTFGSCHTDTPPPPFSISSTFKLRTNIVPSQRKLRQRETQHFVRSANWVFGPKQWPFIRPLLPLAQPNLLQLLCPHPAMSAAVTQGFVTPAPVSPSLLLIHHCRMICRFKGKWWRWLQATVDTVGPSRLKHPDQSKALLGRIALLVSDLRKQNCNLAENDQ